VSSLGVIAPDEVVEISRVRTRRLAHNRQPPRPAPRGQDMTHHLLSARGVLRGVAAAAIVALGFAFLPTAATAAVAEPGWLRLGHLSPSTKAVDVAVTAPSGATVLELNAVSYGDVSPYSELQPGTYTVSMVPAGASAATAPVISADIQVPAKSAMTVVAYGPSSDLEVKAVTDKTSYASGQDPKLSIELANTGSTACTLNVGTSAQVFTITSGSDTWWTSTDCQTQPSDMVVLLSAGQRVSSAQPLTWDRTRSSVATCDAKNRPNAPGGGATYHLSVSIGGVVSTDDALFQLY